jgi:hypothetical protein
MNGVSVEVEKSAEPPNTACIDSRPVGKSTTLRSTPTAFHDSMASATNVSAHV